MSLKAVQPKDRGGFEIAIICALRAEADAVEALFDEYWDEDGDKYGKATGDTNVYTLGSIHCHNVVLAHMPGMGKGSAASVAARLHCSFQNIKLALVAGICGGVPSGTDGEEILLGDVIISTGIVVYDFGRQLPDRFVRKDTLEDVPGRPNKEIRAFLSKLSGSRGRKRLGDNAYGFLQEYFERSDFQKAQYPGAAEDKLYNRTYRHKHQDISACTVCAKCETEENEVCQVSLESCCSELKCSEENSVQRKRLQRTDNAGNADDRKPRIHFGLIASGDTVMKSGKDRDEIASREKVIGFEMEGAGVWEELPCVVIKGVCDYADSHKNKKWQSYAAATAAACVKAFLKERVTTLDLFSDVVVPAQPTHWCVPFGQNKLFVGRESHLEEVIAKLTPEDYEKDCQRVAIAGLGGIGKTQIALEAAFRFRAKHPDCSVLWVSAVDVPSFEAAFLEIGRKFQVTGINENKADVKLLVKAHLSQEIAGRWLLIVDNADDLEIMYKRGNKSDDSSNSLALADYLPFSCKGSVLFTTRNYEAAVNQAGINVITVGEMTESDSLKLLETSLINEVRHTELDSSKKLLDLLSHLPLAIKQAAAFINQKQISIHDYLEIYESDDQELVELLSADFEDQGRYRNIKNPIASTWLISFRQIKRYDTLAAEYLYFMSYVAQRNIPHSLLPAASKLREAQAIGILKAYAFITVREGGKSYDIHRLVQIAVRNWLKTTGEFIHRRYETLKQVSRVFPFFRHENSYECALYFPHVQCILKFQNGLEDSREPLRKLLYYAGLYLDEIGKYIEAEQMFRRSLERSQEFIDDTQTLSIMNSLAVTLKLQGKYAEAETLQRQTLELQKKVLGDHHPTTLGSMSNLAETFRMRRKYTEGETLQWQTLKLRKKVLGEEHCDTLASMNNLAVLFELQGKCTEAERLHRHTLELSKTVLGEDHRETLKSMNNLAIVFNDQGKYAEAEMLHRQTLELRKRILTNDHPDTLSSLYNLAYTFIKQGKYVEAEVLHREALELREMVFGSGHPDTLDSMIALANVLEQQGKNAEAETLRQQHKHADTHGKEREAHGDEDPDIRGSFNDHTEVSRRQGKRAVGDARHSGYEQQVDMLAHQNHRRDIAITSRRKQKPRRGLLGLCC